MEPNMSRQDFAALQPSMIRIINSATVSARSRIAAEDTRDPWDIKLQNQKNMGKPADEQVGALAAASRRRSDRMMRSRASTEQEAPSENAVSEKIQPAPALTSALEDKTNTYLTSRRLSMAGSAKPTSSAVEQPPAQACPTPPSEGEMDGIAVQPGNPQHVAEYVQDIYKMLKESEPRHLVSPTYMDRQPNVNPKMRAILLDWLVDVHKKYKLLSETLMLTVSIVDRFLDKEVIAQRQLQLLGITALMIAAKYEEIHPPQIKEFVNVTDKAYSRDEILRMEVQILQALDFKVCCPTAIHFLQRYQSVNGCTDVHRDLTQYLLELAMVEYKMLKYTSSHQAAACILLSNKLLRRPSWTPACAKHTEMTEPLLKECAKEICQLLENTDTSSLQAVRRKYSQVKYNSVAKLNFMVGPGCQVAPAPSARTVRRSTAGPSELA